jgi:hypothetical protein
VATDALSSTATGNDPAAKIVDIKTFVDTKKPPSETQFAATVAYYYGFEAPAESRKESITSSDLQEACRQVGRARIKNPAQTLVNAHAQGLLDRGDRGAYTINTVGENLVAMALPSDGRGVVAPRQAKRTKKVTTRKSAPKSKRPSR